MSGRSTHDKLFEKYGPLISGRDLAHVAGFRTTDALRMAVRRGRVGFEIFMIPGRRGRFARTYEVESCLDTTGRSPPPEDVAMR